MRKTAHRHLGTCKRADTCVHNLFVIVLSLSQSICNLLSRLCFTTSGHQSQNKSCLGSYVVDKASHPDNALTRRDMYTGRHVASRRDRTQSNLIVTFSFSDYHVLSGFRRPLNFIASRG
ncbi:hypothetical protein J6590_031576 [Homalodisca vitripennis]|nr:hypothetical protein J6590_031576 [Homalodisca vitripennis]